MIRPLSLPCVLCLSLLAAGWAARGETGDWAQRVAEAATTVETAVSTEARLRALTELIAVQDRAYADLSAHLRQLEALQRAALDRLGGQDNRLAAVLAALQRTAPQAVSLPHLHPQGAVAAVRAAGLSEAMIAALAAERWAMDAQVQQVAQALAAVETAKTDLAMLQSRAAQARQDLIAAAARRGPLPPAFDSETAAAQALALDARNIDSLLAGIPQGASTSAYAQNALRPPVRGTWTLATPARDGMVLNVAPQALVTAPAAARVLYAGPLRGHRIVVVLDLGGARTLTLAGLGQALVPIGGAVLAGDALGLMPRAPVDGSQRIVASGAFDTGSLPQETLYMELRDADRPVDPSLWFMVTEDN